MLARLSIRGIYNADNTIFDNMLLPPDVNKEDVILGIFTQCSEMATAFPDPEYCKAMIKSWSYRKLPIWTKLSNLIYLEYNPIENYDRYQETTDNSTARSDNNSQSINAATAFNSEQFKNTDQNTVTADTQSTATVTHNAHLHGNIGVTTVAQMIAGQLETLPRLDIVHIIVKDFADTFCIGLY